MTNQESITRFDQGVDVRRPHSLASSGSCKWRGSLEYRYEDTQEVVSVPNVWYNQPYWERVSLIRFEARRMDDFADRIRDNPPFHMDADESVAIVLRYRERARRMREAADRMEAAGTKTHPVAASLMQLDFSDIAPL